LPTESVPEEIVVAPVKVLAPESVRVEVELFWVTPVTFAPMTELMVTPPVPEPELVTVPVLLRLTVEMVIPAALVLLFCRMRFCAPVMPPLRVSKPVPAFWIVTGALLRVSALETVVAALSAEVTKRPLPAPEPPSARVPLVMVVATLLLIVRLLPVPVPVIVMVPVVPPEILRSSAEVGAATKVPADAPVESVFQNALVPFQAPVSLVKPSAPLVSQ